MKTFLVKAVLAFSCGCYVFYVLGSLPTPLRLLKSQNHTGIPDNSLDGYLVHTPGCIIPDHKNIHHGVPQAPLKLECSIFPPLTEESGLSLIWYQERLAKYGLSKKTASCFYQTIVRVAQKPGNYNDKCDNQWRLQRKISLKSRVTVIDSDGILVTCEDETRHPKKIVYQNVHYFIQPKRIRNVGSKQEMRKTIQWDKLGLNIIVMGLDSVSRGNLQRQMPKTFNYLTKDLAAMDLKGYTKVGDGTDSNLIPLLIGMSQRDLIHHPCLPNGRLRFDDCPLIWRDFASKGYITAYGEDAPYMGCLHYYTDGFCKEPTDYYNRPYFSASDYLIGHKGGYKGLAGNPCQGSSSSLSQIYNYSLAIAESLKEVPYFGFYWSASVTHDFMEASSIADQLSLDYLKKLKTGGYLYNTAVFFISDHGMRWGEFRETSAGMLEEKMPYAIMVFPEKVLQLYPDAMKNLRNNGEKLTSPFDIHATFHAILNHDFTAEYKTRSSTIYGLSLFQEVPLNRTCRDAGIPEHFCTCGRLEEIEVHDPLLLEAAKVAVKEINIGLLLFPACVQLMLHKILYGWRKLSHDGLGSTDSESSVMIFIVGFVTNPGKGRMEATVTYTDGAFRLIYEVSRINLYADQSDCISDRIYRKFCFCKDYEFQISSEVQSLIKAQ